MENYSMKRISIFAVYRVLTNVYPSLYRCAAHIFTIRSNVLPHRQASIRLVHLKHQRVRFAPLWILIRLLLPGVVGFHKSPWISSSAFSLARTASS